MNNTQILKNTLFYNDLNSQTNLDLHYKLSAQQLNLSMLQETSIPLGILKNNSSLEAIVFYLKEILNFRFNEIAILLNRDQRTIWVTYANAKRKKILFNTEEDAGTNSQLYDLQISLPLSMFTSRTFSILETIVFYLKNSQNLSFNQIADVLGKNYRTIWTVYKRALKKIENEN